MLLILASGVDASNGINTGMSSGASGIMANVVAKLLIASPALKHRLLCQGLNVVQFHCHQCLCHPPFKMTLHQSQVFGRLHKQI